MRPVPDELVIELTIEQLISKRDAAREELRRLSRLLRVERKKLARLRK